MAINAPIPTATVPNPLHKYASYTYNLTLWWVSPVDQAAQAGFIDADQALAFNYPFSYVIAEDGGTDGENNGTGTAEYVNRLPQTLGLNYNLQDLVFDTLVGPSEMFGSTTGMTGSFKIIEPYGCTLLESLLQFSKDETGDYSSYLNFTYMLQIDFVGYDDKGTKLTDNNNEYLSLRKRFPIKFTNMGIAFDKSGAIYTVDFYAFAHESAQDTTQRVTPTQFTVVGGTVKEFFDSLSKQYKNYYHKQAITNKAQYESRVNFEFDPLIANSKIVDATNITFSQADPNAKGFDKTKAAFIIPAGTDVEKIITNIMAASYYVKQQLGIAFEGDVYTDQTTVQALFRTTMNTQLIGFDAAGAPHAIVTDAITGDTPRFITYKIHQYVTFKANHPALNQFPDSRAYTVKTYNFLYTGQNVDIIDWKIDLDFSYYTTAMAYTADFASGQTSQNTGNNQKAVNAATLPLTPLTLALGLPILKKIPVLTPQRYKALVNDASQNAGFNTQNSQSTTIAKDVINSVHTDSLNAINIDIEIVGDPTLLMQDELFYSPSPDTQISKEYGSLSQYDYASKYGHVKFNQGDLVVKLLINTPIDIDTDYNNTGLMFPTNYRTSVFSGQYYIVNIQNKFHNGQFTQTLSMSRFLNHDYIEAGAQMTNSQRLDNYVAYYGLKVDSNGVATSLTNSQALIPSNSTTSTNTITPVR